VALYAGAGRVVDRLLAHAGVVLDNGVELRIRAEPTFYPPHGKLQLRMVGVDPAFTVGQLALSRDRLLAALHADGTLARQRAHDAPRVPLRIGLITSAGSAAHHDVVHQLEAAGCAFTVILADARVQGGGCAESVVEALRNLWRVNRRRPLDVVAIVRGGGARTDLMGFDDERIARAIAAMPMPVWTGIGHEIDASVADAAAHTAFPTPTAVAAALRSAVEGARADGAERRGRLRAATAARLDLEERRLLDLRRRLARGQAAALAVHGEQVRARRARLRRGVADALRAARTAHAEAAARLPHALRRALHAEGAHLAVAGRQLDALDPARVLARGFSVTRHDDGRLVTAVGDVGAGDVLVTRLADGSVTSRAIEEEP
jgi:exodeoxyribonuclease VII large subunit